MLALSSSVNDAPKPDGVRALKQPGLWDELRVCFCVLLMDWVASLAPKRTNDGLLIVQHIYSLCHHMRRETPAFALWNHSERERNSSLATETAEGSAKPKE